MLKKILLIIFVIVFGILDGSLLDLLLQITEHVKGSFHLKGGGLDHDTRTKTIKQALGLYIGSYISLMVKKR